MILCSAVGCGGEDLAGRAAHVSVILSRLTTQANATSFVLAPGVYDFVANGVADANSADITVTVLDKQAKEVASLQLSLPLLEANASPGDIGSGATTGVLVDEGVQSVLIKFFWQEGSQQPEG